MTSTVRALLTPIEKTMLNDLGETLTRTESQFCCGGTIELHSERKLSLLYEVGQEHARSLSLPPVKSTDVDKLIDACAPSPHGRGKQTVFDESYRLARELHQGSFALTADILNESGVLASIAALTSPRTPTGGLVAHLYKLNSYGVGGFFKTHRDTPKSDRHVGTLVVALPVPFKGGALRVSHAGKEVLFNWGEEASPAPEKPGLPWAFLFSDVEHEVLPVKSGTRITLTYDIFASSQGPLSESLTMDGTSLPFYSDLKAALKNPDFLSEGGKLGVALSHTYPVNSVGSSDSFASHLKGGDAALHRALSSLGISMELRAVYAPYDADYYPDENTEDAIPDDGFGPVITANKWHYDDSPKILFTSSKFRFLELEGEWREGESELLKEYVGAHVEPEIIWARKPSDDAFAPGGYYVAYGNEASLSSVYAAAALVLNIPGLGQEARASL